MQIDAYMFQEELGLLELRRRGVKKRKEKKREKRKEREVAQQFFPPSSFSFLEICLNTAASAAATTLDALVNC